MKGGGGVGSGYVVLKNLKAAYKRAHMTLKLVKILEY